MTENLRAFKSAKRFTWNLDANEFELVEVGSKVKLVVDEIVQEEKALSKILRSLDHDYQQLEEGLGVVRHPVVVLKLGEVTDESLTV